jgi:hypothetical protein
VVDDMKMHTNGCGHRVLAAAVGIFAWALSIRVAAQSFLPAEARIVAADGAMVLPIQGMVFGGASAFDLPVIDDFGNVAFRGRFVGPSVTSFNERAVFASNELGGLDLVVRSGDPAPGLPAITLQSATGVGMGGAIRTSPDGEVLFGSNLSGPGVVLTNDSAMFVGSLGNVELLVREGSPAPGTSGAMFASHFSSPLASTTALNRGGRVVFQSQLSGGDTTPLTDVAWFGGSPPGLELIARRGAVAQNGMTVGTFGPVGQLNDLDQFLYSVTLAQDAVVTVADDETLWIHTPGLGSVLVLREGDLAPGTAGAVFGNATNTWIAGMGANAFNRLGAFAFAGDLIAGDTVPGVNDRAVFVGAASGITPVVRKGSPAPGTNSVFGTASPGSLSINGAGDVLFQATISGGGATAADDTGIWTGAAGALTLVAREGAIAPYAGGASFGSLSGTQMHFNDRGQVLFTATLTGAGVTGPGNNTALFAYDPVAGVSMVLRGSDAITVGPGVVKAVGSFATVQFGNGDGAALGFNHAGDFALRANMTDGTGAIVAGHVGTLAADVTVLSAAIGGTQTLHLRGGPSRSGLYYFVAGSASGISPGFNFGGLFVPLNVDDYFFIAIQLHNSSFLSNTLGVLDSNGHATAAINLPPGLPAAGLLLHHAFGAYDTVGVPSMFSEPARLEIVP